MRPDGIQVARSRAAGCVRAQNWLIFKFTKMNNIYNQIRAL